MLSIDPSKLPYPGQDKALTRGGRFLRLAQEPGAIAMGTAQWLLGFKLFEGDLRDSEGVLVFTEEGITFHADSGLDASMAYTDIRSYSVKGGIASLMGIRALTLNSKDGPSLFKLGRIPAANADYILQARGIPRA